MSKPPRHPPSRTRKINADLEQVDDRVFVAKAANARQAGLFDALLPAWIAPCLPTLVDKPPIGPEWVHEVKWDGYRVSVYVEDNKVAIYTRN